MSDQTKFDVKTIISNSISNSISPDEMPDDFRLAGENLDSMAVMTLVLALEEHFGIMFDEDDLSAEAFEDINSLTQLVDQKLSPTVA